MFFSFLSLVGFAVACADSELSARDGSHVHARRDYLPITPPYRPLIWGDFNVIHTTDTHGWLLGHQKPSWPEPSYSGDLGDFASFLAHMKQIAVEKDVDLLLVDSGDLHDGTGLSDGYPTGGVDAHESNKFLEQLPYDLMAIGNHELYVYANTYDMHTSFAPRLNGRYLSSNANITVFNSNGEVVSVPVGSRFRKFTTRKGRRVTSFGVLYDFKGNSVNTTVQSVADMVKEQWFTEAIADEPDVFVLVGHMPVSHDKWPVVVDAIRAVHPHTPILVFGGHSHIRDCQQYDGRTVALQSGRYMETIGWIGANLDKAIGSTNNMSFTRRYLDQNRITYEYHTATSNSTFDTPHGRSITHGLRQLAIDFDLGYLYGNAPHDYILHQNPYPSNGSVVSLFIAEATPVALAVNNTRAGIPNLIIANSGALRFSVFEGPFTKNDQLTAAPFSDPFFYLPNIKASVASQVLPTLNSGNTAFKRSTDEEELWSLGHVEHRYRAWLQEMNNRQAILTTSKSTPGELTLGYVTKDGCPDPESGDDTLHVPMSYYEAPIYVSSNPPDVSGDTPIDLVFNKFVARDVLEILNSVQKEMAYTSADVSLYASTKVNEVLGLYAQVKWN